LKQVTLALNDTEKRMNMVERLKCPSLSDSFEERKGSSKKRKQVKISPLPQFAKKKKKKIEPIQLCLIT